jgi:hypothetical protein
VSILSRFLDRPGILHWEAVKRIMRYLIGTWSYQLTFGSDYQELEGYSDADGSTQEHRHAISGYAFLLDGGAISWASKKQEIIALSTTEAEYIAATHAAKEAIWLQKLIKELFPLSLSHGTPLHCDNQSAMTLATTDNYHARTKHIDVRYHFIRNLITTGALHLIYCPTDNMLVDILTKPIPIWKAQIFASALGLRASSGGADWLF